jgi:hypothetical protein
VYNTKPVKVNQLALTGFQERQSTLREGDLQLRLELVSTPFERAIGYPGFNPSKGFAQFHRAVKRYHRKSSFINALGYHQKLVTSPTRPTYGQPGQLYRQIPVSLHGSTKALDRLAYCLKDL